MILDDELTNRIDDILCEDEDIIYCPNCGAPNQPKEKKKKELDLFPTTQCISCKHEWII